MSFSTHLFPLVSSAQRWWFVSGSRFGNFGVPQLATLHSFFVASNFPSQSFVAVVRFGSWWLGLTWDHRWSFWGRVSLVGYWISALLLFIDSPSWLIAVAPLRSSSGFGLSVYFLVYFFPLLNMWILCSPCTCRSLVIVFPVYVLRCLLRFRRLVLALPWLLVSVCVGTSPFVSPSCFFLLSASWEDCVWFEDSLGFGYSGLVSLSLPLSSLDVICVIVDSSFH